MRSYLATLERSLGSVSSSQLSFTPKAPPSAGSAVEARVVRYFEIREMYEEKIARRDAQLLAIEQALETLDSAAERLVMRLRYLEGRSWASVVSKFQAIGYCERQVYYIHLTALRKLKEV